MIATDKLTRDEINKSTKNDEFLGLLEYLDGKDDDDIKRNSHKSCTQAAYIEEHIFPTLLPALNEMLTSAKENLVFQKRRSKFNACDFLTEYLYNNNPKHAGRKYTGLWNIPFVQRINEKNPRPPLPLSLVWTEEEAVVVIQSFWRGHVVRSQAEVQELRRYQKDMREESYHIMFLVQDFWKEHPVEDNENEDP